MVDSGLVFKIKPTCRWEPHRHTHTHTVLVERQDRIKVQSWSQTCPSINISYKKGSLLLLTINGRHAAVSSCFRPIPNHHLVNLLMNISPSFCQAPTACTALNGFFKEQYFITSINYNDLY